MADNIPSPYPGGGTTSWVNAAAGPNALDPTGTRFCDAPWAALMAAMAAGGFLYVPPGTYKFAATPVIPFSGITVWGDDPQQVTFTQTGTTAGGISAAAATSLFNVTIRGITFTGPNTGSGIGISVASNGGAASSRNILVSDCIVQEFGSHGVQILNPILSACERVISQFNNGRGFYLNTGTTTVLANCWAFDNVNERGYYLVNMLSCELVGCGSDNNAIGYELSGCGMCTLIACDAFNTAAGSSGLDGSSVKFSNTSYCCGARAVGVFANAAVGCYITSGSGNISLDGYNETATAGATAGIKTDTGTTLIAANYFVTTATSFATNTTSIVNLNSYSAFPQLEVFQAFFVDGTAGVSGVTTLNGLTSLNGGSDTSGTAAVTSPSFTTGTALQVNSAQDAILYYVVKTAGTYTIAIGPANTTTTTLVSAVALPVGAMQTIRVPKGWFVKITGTIANLTITAVTC